MLFPAVSVPSVMFPLASSKKLVGKKVPTNSYSKFGVPSFLLFSLTPTKPGTLEPFVM